MISLRSDFLSGWADRARSARNPMPGSKISLKSKVLSGCANSVKLSLASSLDQIWQRTVEQNLDEWVEHESASRFLVRIWEPFEKVEKEENHSVSHSLLRKACLPFAGRTSTGDG